MKTFFFFFWRTLAPVSLVLGLGLEHSCPWPREVLSSERLSLALALASDFFCVLGLGLGLEPCVLDSTSDQGCRSLLSIGGYNLQFYPNFALFSTLGGMNLDHDIVQVSQLSEDQKKGLHQKWNTFFLQIQVNTKKRSSPKTEHFFSPNSSGHLRSDAHQSQIIGWDADVDHAQTSDIKLDDPKLRKCAHFILCLVTLHCKPPLFWFSLVLAIGVRAGIDRLKRKVCTCKVMNSV